MLRRRFEVKWRSLSVQLGGFSSDLCPVLAGSQFQTAPCQLIEIDNGEPRLGGMSGQGLHPVERCPGAPEPVAPVPAPADARSTSNSGPKLAHPRAAHRSVTAARGHLCLLLKVPDDHGHADFIIQLVHFHSILILKPQLLTRRMKLFYLYIVDFT